ncbi:hypothetical protein MBLNU230_g6013t1 [Neophaeotheca triangularis]
MQQYRNIWQKRVLLPIWIPQIIGAFFALAIGVIAIHAAALLQDHQDADDYSHEISIVQLAGGLVVAFASTTLLLCFLEIGLAARHVLHPAVLLGFQCVKLPLWSYYLVAHFISVATGGAGWPVVLAMVLFLTTFSALVYASIIYHRKRKGLLAFHGNANANAYQHQHHHPLAQSQQHEMYAPTDTHLSVGSAGRDPFRDPSRQNSHAVPLVPQSGAGGYGSEAYFGAGAGAGGRGEGRYYA